MRQIEARDDIAPAGVRPEAERVFAAIDLGTNNCRLMLGRARGEGFAIVDSFSRIVRLGEGLARNGRLLDTAIDRTMQALEICAGKIERWGVTDQRHIATEACRRAANCEEFVARVAERTGLALEIIPPREEARLALAGCVPLIDRRRPRAVLIDIGGGSTEGSWIGTDDGESSWLSVTPTLGINNGTQGNFNPGPLRLAAGIPDAPWPPQYPKQPGEATRVAPSRARRPDAGA